MPLKLLAPIIEEFILENSDRVLGTDGTPTTVSIKQATVGEDLLREDVWKNVTQTITDNNDMQLTAGWTVAQLYRKEVFLTLVGCNILNEKGKPLFRFASENGQPKLNMAEQDFNAAWGLLPSIVAKEIHEKVREVNINWNGPLVNTI